MTWIIMPILDNLQQSLQAISDVIGQDVPTKLLLIDQGSSDETRTSLRTLAEVERRVLLWTHDPCLPSLSATWNRALDFVWARGEESALVANNDIRLDPSTVRVLVRTLVQDHALMVTATGCDQAGWDLAHDGWGARVLTEDNLSHHGGPDFSCFLISKECHDQFPFDEHYIPAYCEDVCVHRQIMLAGERSRIFSINLPFLHYASGTMKAMTPERRIALESRIGQSRRYFAQQWGGGCNEETYLRKGDPDSAVSDGTATTPWLQFHAKGV